VIYFIMGNLDLLTRLQNEAMSLFEADLLPDGTWQTKCNFGLEYIANRLGCHDFDGRTATEIVLYASELRMASTSGWITGDWDGGVACAMKGGLAFLGITAPKGQHGHVATIAPKPMRKSPSWGVLVPWLANIGKPPNAVKLASACFLTAQRPSIRCFWKSM
jgi:hypothetical protein